MLQDLLLELNRFDAEAAERTQCLRKGVAAVAFTVSNEIVAARFNGPVEGQQCSGEKGKCGCAHSELRLIMSMARGNVLLPREPLILYTTYSACDFCAHLIVESKLFRGYVYRHFADHWPRGIEIIRANGIEVLTIEAIKQACFLDGLRGANARDTIEQWKSSVRNS